MQDGDITINYDLHWNPVKLIQRFDRIDRIGSDKDVIYGFNFLPELGIERNLGLKQKLKNRIQDEEIKAQVNILEKVFRALITQAINKELNTLRRNGVTGQNLFDCLVQIDRQHNMREWLDRSSLPVLSHPMAAIVCSEALI